LPGLLSDATITAGPPSDRRGSTRTRFAIASSEPDACGAHRSGPPTYANGRQRKRSGSPTQASKGFRVGLDMPRPQSVSLPRPASPRRTLTLQLAEKRASRTGVGLSDTARLTAMGSPGSQMAQTEPDCPPLPIPVHGIERKMGQVGDSQAAVPPAPLRRGSRWVGAAEALTPSGRIASRRLGRTREREARGGRGRGRGP
jgi:hypothetical protein